MKNYFFISLTFISFILIACNPNSKPTNDEAPHDLINNLINKHDHTNLILNTHNNDQWVEDSTQFGMQGTNQLFDVITTDDNTKYKDNKSARREVYLAFEYHKDAIKEFGIIANKLADGALKGSAQDIQILKDVIKEIRQYAKNYFLTASTPLINKKDELASLNLSELKTLTNQFQIIEQNKQILKNGLIKIKEDFNKDHNNIKTGNISNLINYLIHNYLDTFENASNTIKDACKEINSILSKI
ncbi:hypothetical protein bcCo53_001124 (plasmid) [Borrelia coriaceae]|uniref:Antigen P35 n=1 Tax=Borrelia coriaceae ATCC 43381 TaxID=1408429 RepID=W5SWA4_9SPIR|nr:virulence associated lipoprotein [Borrelia coriaceae]AHH11172.1 Hypothetical protein BCO_0028700 [Borrelia coriaceae ATCC 43381]UPA16956.1 hypothetical protein bcCo53_001124 [Borrelia coriaceae]